MTITHAQNIPAQEGLKDPVCGMKVTPASPYQHAYQGLMFFFCNPKCLDKFRADPPHYLHPIPASETPAPPLARGTEYTCPHAPRNPADGPWHLPQVRHGPGAGHAFAGGG